jgi:predicted MFS family arabinose efflux permease
MSAPQEVRREWLVMLVLSGIQFSQMVDFMVLMPLGTQLMREFGITPTQLGFFVSIYTVAASLSGFFSALVIDRFDRRTAVLALYACFAVTMAACALAPGYWTLLAARTAAGAFGGVVAANIFTIVTDLVPEGRRGRAFGAVMSAFSLASILGVPISLALALHFTWRAPYVFLAVMCSSILVSAWFVIPPVRAHLSAARERNALARIRSVFGELNHLRIFAFSSTLVFSGFLVFPFIAPYLVTNAGVSEADLPFVYLIAGIAALVTARLAGGWSDSLGRRAVFAGCAVATAVAALAMTTLPRSPLFVAILVSMLMFAASSARMVPAMALITSGAEPRLRGSVMSFNASIQQLAAGAASLVASLIIGRSADGELTGYWVVGILSAAGTLACIALARRVRPAGTAVQR